MNNSEYGIYSVVLFLSGSCWIFLYWILILLITSVVIKTLSTSWDHLVHSVLQVPYTLIWVFGNVFFEAQKSSTAQSWVDSDRFWKLQVRSHTGPGCSLLYCPVISTLIIITLFTKNYHISSNIAIQSREFSHWLRGQRKKGWVFLIVLIAREMASVLFLSLPKSDINESLWEMSLLCWEAKSSAPFHSFSIKTPPSFLNTKYCYLLPFLQFFWFLKWISLSLTGFPPSN